MSPDAQPWTTRSLLQANGSQSTYYTVTIHPSAANRAAVQGQVARLAAMSPHDLQNLLRAQGVHSHGAPLPPTEFLGLQPPPDSIWAGWAGTGAWYQPASFREVCTVFKASTSRVLYHTL